MSTDETAISAGLQEPFQRKLARSILKSDSAEDIALTVRQLVSSSLGWNQPQCFHFEISVGASFGFKSGPERCVVKVFGPDSTLPDLRSRARFQGWLHSSQYPCPAVLVSPQLERGLLFAVEEYIDRGRRADGHASFDRRLMATELARLVDLGQSYPDQAEIPTDTLVTVPSSPWPKPHNVLFDFEATARGAEWIDEIGWRYMSAMDSNPEPRVIGHLDWGAKHCRILDDMISVIYDWDSVARMPETRVLGAAAVNFVASWYVAGTNTPDIHEMTSFIDAYVRARSRAFDAAEMEHLIAAIYYGAAYGARCEHAIAKDQGNTENRDFLKDLLSCNLEAELANTGT